ncbi:MAG: Transcriptional regulator [uncultured Thermomicrobiales bacterium]|uniref:Transcriptional regulator n=1 Tax=uncultured Thermomicrobiales bacterium TaxID=1645740 RepID=A0A6J4V3C7_9BACT|nr:MAG: Transcriptional regulator [uncultured Thermomicrobiales bacterium]
MTDELTAHDFDRARQKAFLHDLLAVVGRRPNDLIPYHEVRQRLSPERESYRGLQTVPIDQIVGSMDRFQDFDRAFLPRQRHTARRWRNVDRAYYDDVTLPPIQLYKVGDIYFVKDGNHRVSVAREKGVDFIDAEVIEGHVRVPLYASMRPQELLLQVEYAEFLRRTDIDRIRPDHDIRPTALGRYDEIWTHIRGHQQWLSAIWHRPATVAEAVADWYDYIYRPIVRVVAERGVLDRFPHHTEADVYLWVMRHRGELEEREGRDVGPIASATDYAEEVTHQPGPVGRLAEGLRHLAARVIPGLDDDEEPDPHRPITPDPFPVDSTRTSAGGATPTSTATPSAAAPSDDAPADPPVEASVGDGSARATPASGTTPGAPRSGDAPRAGDAEQVSAESETSARA